MLERLEGHFWGYQDAELFYQVWKPKTPRGTIVVTHGIAEHSDCYQSMAEAIAADGWIVFTWDLRGHGRSEGKRGYVARFQDLCDDLDNAIRFVKAEINPRGLPLILFGHSMGGLITTKTLLTNNLTGINALTLSAPAFGLSLKVPALKAKAATILADWAPKLTLHNEIQFDNLVRDDQLVRDYKADPLRHDKISPKMFVGMMEAISEVRTRAHEIHLPILLQLAGRDKIINTPDAEAVFSTIPSKRKEIYIYTDSYHEIFNDFDRKDVIKDYLKFVDSFAPAR